MTVKFESCLPPEIRNDLLAVKFLEQAASGFGAAVHVENILNNFDEKQCLLIIVKIDKITVGSIFLTFTQQETGKVMTSVLLGGVNFKNWATDLRNFYYLTAKTNQCDEFMLMGRKGFKRYFPELEEVATVFRVSLI